VVVVVVVVVGVTCGALTVSFWEQEGEEKRC